MKYAACPSNGLLESSSVSVTPLPTTTSELSPGITESLTLPVNCVEPRPTATNPKLPNDELEFVRSHCAPLLAKIAMSQLIVNMETNWA